MGMEPSVGHTVLKKYCAVLGFDVNFQNVINSSARLK